MVIGEHAGAPSPSSRTATAQQGESQGDTAAMPCVSASDSRTTQEQQFQSVDSIRSYPGEACLPCWQLGEAQHVALPCHDLAVTKPMYSKPAAAAVDHHMLCGTALTAAELQQDKQLDCFSEVQQHSAARAPTRSILVCFLPHCCVTQASAMMRCLCHVLLP